MQVGKCSGGKYLCTHMNTRSWFIPHSSLRHVTAGNRREETDGSWLMWWDNVQHKQQTWVQKFVKKINNNDIYTKLIFANKLLNWDCFGVLPLLVVRVCKLLLESSGFWLVSECCLIISSSDSNSNLHSHSERTDSEAPPTFSCLRVSVITRAAVLLTDRSALIHTVPDLREPS